jgi:hypothetical protein
LEQPTTFITDLDRSKLIFIQQIYLIAVQSNHSIGLVKYPSVQPIRSNLEFFRIPIYLGAMRLISFFKQIPEFQQLDENEQINLVKRNTLNIVFLHSLFIYNGQSDVYHEKHSLDPIILGQDWIRTLDDAFHRRMKRIHQHLADLLRSDQNLVKLFFIILLFSPATSDDASTVKIAQLQDLYTDLLSKYCLDRYGLVRSSNVCLRYITQILHIQTLVEELRANIRCYLDPSDLSSLVQSLI